MKLKKLSCTLLFVPFILSCVFAAGSAMAQDCPRGDLDERYCDRDGELVADVPENESDWVDPNTIIFAYTPVEDPAVYK